MARSQNYYLRTFHGIILIGLGVLAIIHYWWPGVLFVFGIALFVDALLLGKAWRSFITPLILILLGLLFRYNQMLGPHAISVWPIVLIVIGLAIIFFRRH